MKEQTALQEVTEIAVKADGFFDYLFHDRIKKLTPESPQDNMLGQEAGEAHAELKGMIWTLYLTEHITREQREAAIECIREIRWPEQPAQETAAPGETLP